MSKYLYVIMHLPLQRYLKWWADRFAYLKELFFVRISETNPAYLTDCLKAKFLKFIIKGKTEQGQNPSPDNPQEIRNVEGINIFDKNAEGKTQGGATGATKTTLDTGVRAISVSAGTSRFFAMKMGGSELLGKTLTLSAIMTPNASNKPQISIYMGDETRVALSSTGYSLTQTGKLKINMPSAFATNCNTFYILFYSNTNGTAVANDYVDYTNLMLVEGDTLPNTYVPYNCIQIKKCNKNLLDTSTCVGGSFNTAGVYSPSYISVFTINKNKITVTSTESYRGFVSDYIEVKPNTNYKLSYKTEETGLSIVAFYAFYDENKQNGIRNTTGLSPATAKYMRVYAGASLATTVNYYDIQVEEGLTATDYVSHAEKTYNFPLSEGQKLMKGDYIDKVGIHHTSRQIILNGTESWNFSSSTNVFYVDIPNLNHKTSNNVPICNYYKGISNVGGTGELNNNEIALVNIANPQRIYIKDTNFNNVSDYKLWLSTHNLIVEYELEEETIESYTPEQKAVYDEIINDGTYKGITNIEVTANINPDLYIEYKSSKEEE